MFIKVSDKKIINIEQVRAIEGNDSLISIYMSEDHEQYFVLIGDEARVVWDYFNLIATTPGGEENDEIWVERVVGGMRVAMPIGEQPEQMSRREAELLNDYGNHKSSCTHWNSDATWTCDCLYPELLEQAQFILEQSE